MGRLPPALPDSSGQTITVSAAANSVLDNANLVAQTFPGRRTDDPNASSYIEECTDPGGTTANLPYLRRVAVRATDNVTVRRRSAWRRSSDAGYIVYDLPDPGTLGSATMTGRVT